MSAFDAHRRGEAVRFSRRNVCIVSGQSSRTKVIEVSEVGLEAVQRLATEGEMS
ncbi:MAG: hypothetical protein M3P26_05975 [Gemmatimonadota bacterium]|nr:hypothetical protein [Gemmatimonadota bacterium]